MKDHVGRFAPTPSGPLHFGSLIAALGSYCEARHRGGEWHLRIDDLDTPRNAPGAVDTILHSLEAYGFEWDGEVDFQSRHLQEYHEALERLRSADMTYPCACTRKQVGTGPYPGTCANGLATGATARAVRVRVDSACIEYQDRIQGCQSCRLADESGDFIIHRADGQISYHLATVLDDARIKTTDVIRGADLLTTTARHRYLQSLLGLPQPAYAHLPVVCYKDGRKYSKQNHAAPLETDRCIPCLLAALEFLGQDTSLLDSTRPNALLREAASVWDIDRVPNYREIILRTE